jgi:hypothetical protein
MGMSKKYYNKVAVGTYAAVLLAVASFGAQFAYEGWATKGVSPMLTPIGIGSIVLFVVAIGLFIWNLRREELTHEQWQGIVEARREPLVELEAKLTEYKDYTNKLAKAKKLYNLALYGLSGVSVFEIYSIVSYNKHYADLKDKDTHLGTLLSDIEMLVSKLANKKLRKHIHSLYRREDIAHSYSIFLTLYKTHYKPHSLVEKRINKNKSIPLFEQAFMRVYKWIGIMKRGKDLE